jgi:hypothetical protein
MIKTENPMRKCTVLVIDSHFTSTVDRHIAEFINRLIQYSTVPALFLKNWFRQLERQQYYTNIFFQNGN